MKAATLHRIDPIQVGSMTDYFDENTKIRVFRCTACGALVAFDDIDTHEQLPPVEID